MPFPPRLLPLLLVVPLTLNTPSLPPKTFATLYVESEDATSFFSLSASKANGFSSTTYTIPTNCSLYATITIAEVDTFAIMVIVSLRTA